MTAAADPRRQQWSADTYDTHARFVSDLAAGVVEWLAPVKGERILDLGCGDGVLTAELAAAGASVVGVDTSAEFIAAARARGVDARLMDGQALSFRPEFDGVFSNAALHWMPDAAAVLRGVARALVPGGRFVAYQVSRQVHELACPLLGPAQVAVELRNIPPMRLYRWDKPAA